MRLLLLLWLLLAAACSTESTSPGGGACESPAPIECPGGVAVLRPDPASGCDGWVCESCPEVAPPDPSCPASRLDGIRDPRSRCLLEWVCRPCEGFGQPRPSCAEGRPEPVLHEESGCQVGWECTACEEPPPPGCEEGKAREIVHEGCVVAWECEGCPHAPTAPDCDVGRPAATYDDVGCVESWSCFCPDAPAAPSCDDGILLDLRDADGCVVGWDCRMPTCAGACGAAAATGCRCDAGCEAAGTCCADKADFCGGWKDVEHLRDDALIGALEDRLKAGQRKLTYDEARDELFGPVSDDGGQVECVYTGRRASTSSARNDGFNTEHSWPQSQGADKVPARSDLHHLFPTDMDANSRRGSLDFGMTDCNPKCSWREGGSEVGPSNTRSGTTIFEVRPSYRGDIARAHFYFAVRYGKSIAGEEPVLRAWHVEDPPDERERARNDIVESIQGNRNPFVDRPDFVDRIADF